MGRVIDFTTRLPVENTGFKIPMDKIRGVAEHPKIFHVVYKRFIYEVKKKNLETTVLFELPKTGGGNIKTPVQVTSNKYYTTIIDNENIFMVDVDTQEAAHIWYPDKEITDEFADD